MTQGIPPVARAGQIEEGFEPAGALIDELAGVLAEAIALPAAEAARYVRPIVTYLQQQYGGDEMYIPRPGRSYPISDIVAAYRRGDSIERICKRYGISRRTYFNLMAQHRR